MDFVFHAAFHDSFNKTRSVGIAFDIRKFLQAQLYRIQTTECQWPRYRIFVYLIFLNCHHDYIVAFKPTITISRCSASFVGIIPLAW